MKMNREIKFRAWQKYHKKMVEVTNISFDHAGEIDGVTTFVEDQAPQWITYKDGLLGRFFLKNEDGMVLEIMQYTGLKDKNGVDIYEGDILYFEPYETHGNDRVVEYIDGAYRGRLIRNGYSPLLSDCVYETRVIGNIYQNPELLEVEV